MCQSIHVIESMNSGADGAHPPDRGTHRHDWTFLTNHAHVLLCAAAQPDIRVRDLAERVGITERAALRILHELVEAGYLDRRRVGRRTHYVIHPDRAMRHPVERTQSVGRLLECLADAWAELPSPS
jgi:predicted ArsR family transcriptional regulator